MKGLRSRENGVMEFVVSVCVCFSRISAFCPKRSSPFSYGHLAGSIIAAADNFIPNQK